MLDMVIGWPDRHSAPASRRNQATSRGFCGVRGDLCRALSTVQRMHPRSALVKSDLNAVYATQRRMS
jgi:hypothetical protein